MLQHLLLLSARRCCDERAEWFYIFGSTVAGVLRLTAENTSVTASGLRCATAPFELNVVGLIVCQLLKIPQYSLRLGCLVVLSSTKALIW